MFMRKDTEERTGFLLSLLGGTVIKKYAKFGDFVTGVSGGYIGEDARAELEALVLRSSLSVPELRFNRQTYFEGYNTISPGGGLKIKSFVANSDGSYTVIPDLEDGVPLGQKPDDILLGFWHDKSVTTGEVPRLSETHLVMGNELKSGTRNHHECLLVVICGSDTVLYFPETNKVTGSDAFVMPEA